MLLKLVTDKLYARQRSASATESTVFHSFLEHEERRSRESTPFSDCGAYLETSQSPHQQPLTEQDREYRLNELICQFCRKLMTTERQPILLQCGHSLCKSCVELMPIFGQSVNDQQQQQVALHRSQVSLHAAAPSSSLFVLIVDIHLY
jgi:hypothetical protein